MMHCTVPFLNSHLNFARSRTEVAVVPLRRAPQVFWQTAQHYGRPRCNVPIFAKGEEGGVNAEAVLNR